MSSEEENVQDLPGLPLTQFTRAVDAVADLRDEGKLLLFLRPSSRVKVIGDVDLFRRVLSERIDGEVDANQAERALQEIANYCTAWGHFRSVERVVGFLEETIYDDEFRELDEPNKTRFRHHESAKVTHAAERLFGPSMLRRARRMQTATLPLLEDMDAETVRARRDNAQGASVDEPFLRIRLRYRARGSSDSPWGFFVGFPWGEGVPIASQSFEFECDETDIDLLILRLTSAKNLLNDAVPDPSPSPDS